MPPETGINLVCFLLIAVQAKSLQIADIILAATGERNDMVNAKVSFYGSFTTTSALVLVTLKNIFLYFRRNTNAGSFAHLFSNY